MYRHRNRFDNRNPLGRLGIRYKRDASYNDEFEDFFEEFEEILHDILDDYVYDVFSMGIIDFSDGDAIELEIGVNKNSVTLDLYQDIRGRAEWLIERDIEVYGMNPDAFYRACKKFKKQLRVEPSKSGKVATLQYFNEELYDLKSSKSLRKNVIKALKAVLAEAVPNHMKVY